MLKINKLTDHATRLMLAISLEPEQHASAPVLAHKTGLEMATTSKLLKMLSKSSLLQASRGSAGGYRLAKPASQISMADVVVAIEGPIGMTDCSHGQGHCDQESFCGTSHNWKLISVAIETALRNVSLADLATSKKSSSRKIPTPWVVEAHGETP